MFNIVNSIEGIKSLLEYPHLCLIASLILLLLSLNLKKLYGMWILHQRLEKGDPLPDRLANFPIHSTSMEDYLKSKEKIDLFVSQALNGDSCKINFSADDINNLYLRGETINKYKTNNNIYTSPIIFKYTNDYSYFQIIDNRLLDKTIRYVSIVGVDGIATETRETRFKNQNSLVMTNHQFTEWNGKKMDSDTDWSDDKFYAVYPNDLLLCKLLTTDFVLYPYDENDNQRKLISSVIEKITSIEIADGHLTIKIEQ